MKKQLTLAIPNPCSEKWTSFSKTQLGGFCGSCSKEVIDFTTMTDEEILNYFSNHAGHTCGRFRPNQLKSYTLVNSSVRPGFGLLKAGLFSLLLLVISKPGASQNISGRSTTELVAQQKLGKVQLISTDINNDHSVSGVVKAEDDLPLPGVNIVLVGSDIGTTSDTDGHFEFPQPLNEGDKLVFSFIGYVPYEYKVPKRSADVIEINLSMDLDITGEVSVGEVYQEPTSGFSRLFQKIKLWF